MILNFTDCPMPVFFPDDIPVTVIWNEDGTGADVHKEYGRYIIRLPHKELFVNLGLRQELVNKYYKKALLPFSLIHELLHIYYHTDDFSTDAFVGDSNKELLGEVFNFLEDRRIEQNALRDINGIYRYEMVANAISALRNIKKGLHPKTAFLLEQAFGYQQTSKDKRKEDTRNAFRFAGNALKSSDLRPLITLVRNALSDFYEELEREKKDMVIHVSLGGSTGGQSVPSSGGKDDKKSGGSAPAKQQGRGSAPTGKDKNGKYDGIDINVELVKGNGSSGPRVIVPKGISKEVENAVVDAIEDFLKDNELYSTDDDGKNYGDGYSPGSRREILRTVPDASFLDKVRVEQAPLIEYLREKYLRQKIRYQSIYRANDGDYNPERIEELEKMMLLRDDLASPYETPGANTYSRTDLCIVLDQSGSTGYKDVYKDMATMAAVFLIAFEDFEELRTCLISLKGDTTVCKFFDEPVEATALRPVAESGTPIDPALRLALKQNWESDLRFLVLISDGIFAESELNSLPELKNNGINLVAMSSAEPIPSFDVHLFMDNKKELPEKLSSFIFPEMIEGFYQEL